MAEQKITIIGAGLVGSLLAGLLAKRGFCVDVYEKRGDMRRGGAERGRSINLALSARGRHALKKLGVEDRVISHAVAMRGRMVHPLDGAENLQTYGTTPTDCIYSISRSGLNERLMNEAEGTGKVSFHFNRRITDIDLSARVMRCVDENSTVPADIPFSLVMGTDGTSSALRDAIEKHAKGRVSQQVLGHGYKELVMPPTRDGSYQLASDALHIWPRETFMLIALPNEDRSFTCTLFLPFEGKLSFKTLDTPASVMEFFKTTFPDVVSRIPGLTSEFFNHPTGKMTTVRSLPWHSEGNAVLLGDAAHAMVPFFGQGMNCGFEDVSELDELIGMGNVASPRWEAIFELFQKQRKTNADAIADMAIENFVEMRDKVANERYLLERRVEKLLHQKFPNDYVNRYQLVTFTRVPYRVAYELGERQAMILNELCEGIAGPEEVNLRLAEDWIREHLTPIMEQWTPLLKEAWPS